MERGNSAETDGTVRLQIEVLKRPSDNLCSPTTTMFEPQTSIEKRESSAANSSSPSPGVRAPEKKVTLFALRLAVLEKTATGLGTLSFIWATVVLLGGFAITLEKTDFWIITIILLIEGTRIFSRSHELEWQHQSTWSLTDAGINSFRLLRSSSRVLARVVRSIFRPISAVRSTAMNKREMKEEAAQRARPEEMMMSKKKLTSRRWESSDVPLLPYAHWVFVSSNVSKVVLPL